jgi:hypothetical protein
VAVLSLTHASKSLISERLSATLRGADDSYTVPHLPWIPNARPVNFFRLRRAAVCASALLFTACGPGGDSSGRPDGSGYTVANAGSLPRLETRWEDTLVMGSLEDSVFSITDFEIHDGNAYVVDEMTKTVHVFPADGGPRVRRLGRAGSGPGEFRMPSSVAFSEEGVLVMDPSHGKRVSLFGYDGRFIQMRNFDTPTAATSITTDGGRMIGIGVLAIADPALEGRNVLGITDAAGRRLGDGCVMDERYLESSRTRGMIGALTYGSVAARGGRIYCTQMISPVVQVMDSLGRPIEQIRLEPRFYQAPEDRPVTQDRAEILKYLATFTAHVAFYPVEGGFVSVFSRYSGEWTDIRYHLLVCDTTRGEPRCGVVHDLPKPVYIPSLDRVYIEESRGLDEPMRISVYRIAPVR